MVLVIKNIFLKNNFVDCILNFRFESRFAYDLPYLNFEPTAVRFYFEILGLSYLHIGLSKSALPLSPFGIFFCPVRIN